MNITFGGNYRSDGSGLQSAVSHPQRQDGWEQDWASCETAVWLHGALKTQGCSSRVPSSDEVVCLPAQGLS